MKNAGAADREGLIKAGGALLALGIGLVAGQPAMKYARSYAGLSPTPTAPMAPHRAPGKTLASATSGGQAPAGQPTPVRSPTPVVILATITPTPTPPVQSTPDVTPTPSDLAKMFSSKATPNPEEERKRQKTLDDAVAAARKRAEEIKARHNPGSH